MRELFLFQTWNLEILVSTWPWKENHDKLGLSSSCVISLALCLPLPFSWLLVCLRVPVDLDLQSWTLLASLFVSEQSCWQIPLFSWSLCFFSLHQYPLYLHKRKKKKKYTLSFFKSLYKACEWNMESIPISRWDLLGMLLIAPGCSSRIP